MGWTKHGPGHWRRKDGKKLTVTGSQQTGYTVFVNGVAIAETGTQKQAMNRARCYMKAHKL